MSTTVPSDSESTSAYLIWEDAEKESWWLSRSHDGDSSYVIALDSITSHVLVLCQPSEGGKFRVIAAIHIGQRDDAAAAVAQAKRAAVRWTSDSRSSEIKSGVRRWRLQRWSKIALREIPLALVSVAIGSILAFFVAAFFIMTEITGWPMVAIGTLLGLTSGWLLKWAADRKFTSLVGPLGRFVTVTGSATAGAFLTVSAFFVLFTN